MTEQERTPNDDAGRDQAPREARSRLDRELDRSIGELPPNVPPGLLGEKAPDLYAVDEDGPHGLNAGLIQESTENTALLLVALLFFIFFPAAFVVLWRSKTVPQRHKVVSSIVMAVALLAFGVWWAIGG